MNDAACSLYGLGLIYLANVHSQVGNACAMKVGMTDFCIFGRFIFVPPNPILIKFNFFFILIKKRLLF